MLGKQSLNSEGHQFHQYQQEGQSHMILTSLNIKRPRHVTLEIQVLVRDRHINVVGLNMLMEFQITGPRTAILYKQDDKQNLHRFNKTTYSHKNEWQYEDEQCNNTVNECS